MRSKQHWLPEVRVGCNLYAYLSRYRQAEAGMVQFDFFQQLRRSCVRAVSDGRNIIESGVFPRYWTSNVFEYDFGRPVFCGGCSANQIGAALGDAYF